MICCVVKKVRQFGVVAGFYIKIYMCQYAFTVSVKEKQTKNRVSAFLSKNLEKRKSYKKNNEVYISIMLNKIKKWL